MNQLTDRKILITGGAGFIGSYIAEQLIQENVKEVVLLDNFIRGSKNNINDVLSSGKAVLVEGDIRDRELLNNLFRCIASIWPLFALIIV